MYSQSLRYLHTQFQVSSSNFYQIFGSKLLKIKDQSVAETLHLGLDNGRDLKTCFGLWDLSRKCQPN